MSSVFNHFARGYLGNDNYQDALRATRNLCPLPGVKITRLSSSSEQGRKRRGKGKIPFQPRETEGSKGKLRSSLVLLPPSLRPSSGFCRALLGTIRGEEMRNSLGNDPGLR